MKDEIIEMAKEAGFNVGTAPQIERFYDLAVQREREACAKVCEARYMGDNNREDMEARRCAAAIRARKD